MAGNELSKTILSSFRRYKTSMKNVGYYFLASFIPMVINLFLSPVYSLYLSAEDFAIVGYYASFSGLLGPLFLFQLNQYYTREYFFRKEEDRKSLRAMIFKSFLVFPFVILVISLIGLFVYVTIIRSESVMPFSPYAFLTLLPLALVGIYRLELIDCKVQRRGKSYFIISMSNSILLIIFTVLFVVLLRMGAVGKLLGALVPSSALFVWAFIRHRDLLQEKFDWRMFRSGVVFCFPLVIAGMLGFFSGGYDKIYLEKYVPLNQLGIYTIGLTIASYLSVFSNAIGETFNPDIYESIANNNKRRAMLFIGIQLIIMVVIVATFILLAKYAIIVLTANRYVDSTPFARIASIAAICSLVHYSVTPFIHAAKKTWVILYKDILGSIVCVILYGYFIRLYGLTGAAWVYALNPLVFAFFAYVLYKMSIRLNRNNKKLQN